MLLKNILIKFLEYTIFYIIWSHFSYFEGMSFISSVAGYGTYFYKTSTWTLHFVPWIYAKIILIFLLYCPVFNYCYKSQARYTCAIISEAYTVESEFCYKCLAMTVFNISIFSVTIPHSWGWAIHGQNDNGAHSLGSW